MSPKEYPQREITHNTDSAPCFALQMSLEKWP